MSVGEAVWSEAKAVSVGLERNHPGSPHNLEAAWCSGLDFGLRIAVNDIADARHILAWIDAEVHDIIGDRPTDVDERIAGFLGRMRP